MALNNFLAWLNIWSRTILSAPTPPGDPPRASEADFLAGERLATLAFRPRRAVVAVAAYLAGVRPDDDPDVVAAVDEGNWC